ncbi:hypothetical protein CLV47_102143 [Antricoccus suffuscus]|uniref:Uncharacterized protein n=1 Tax=Antricoccus suffuscus TaxID=1629062 RepID=A0A2T1A4N0_9ACTN|nr:hypothetical protein [Antricoccus suffuscus]PRZ43457.1 hypothetical protein CLV47_102143 [Antricoccus suffuscus]
MLVLTHGSPDDAAQKRFFETIRQYGPGRRNFPGLIVLGDGFTRFGPISGVALTAEGIAVIGVQEIPDASGYLFAPARGAWTVGGRLIHLGRGGSNPVHETDTAVKNVAAVLRKRGIDPGYMQSLIVVDGDISGVAQPETERSSGVVVVRTHQDDIADGIVRATSQTTGGLKQLWTSADVLAALRILGYDGSQVPVEALTNEGFPYSPYVLRPTSTEDSPVAAVPEHAQARLMGHGSAADAPTEHTRPNPRVAAVPLQASAPLAVSEPAAADSLLDAPEEDDIHRSPFRWLAGLAALAVLIAAVVFGAQWLFSGSSDKSAGNGGSGSNTSQGAGASDGAAGTTTPAAQQIDGLAFQQGAYDQTAKCATFSYGEIKSLLTQIGCSGLTRALYLTDVDGKQVVVSVADVKLKSDGDAAKLKSKVDSDGTGNVNDLLRDGVIPKGYPSTKVFDNAEYASSIDGQTVRIVETAFTDGGDPSANVNKAADVALKLKIDKQ